MSILTQAHLDAIDLAIASGTVTVSYSDRTVTYRSLEELLRIRGLIVGEQAEEPRTYRLAATRKGV